MEVLSPVLEPDKKAAPLARRLDTFDGKTVAVLWNNRTHGDKLLKRVHEALVSKYEPKAVVFRKKAYHGEPMTRDLLDELASSVDVVITGVGD